MTRQNSPAHSRTEAMRAIAFNIMVIGVALFLLGVGVLAVLWRDTQPDIVFALPVGLMLFGGLYAFKGMTYWLRRPH